MIYKIGMICLFTEGRAIATINIKILKKIITRVQLVYLLALFLAGRYGG